MAAPLSTGCRCLGGKKQAFTESGICETAGNYVTFHLYLYYIHDTISIILVYTNISYRYDSSEENESSVGMSLRRSNILYIHQGTLLWRMYIHIMINVHFSHVIDVRFCVLQDLGAFQRPMKTTISNSNALLYSVLVVSNIPLYSEFSTGLALCTLQTCF